MSVPSEGTVILGDTKGAANPRAVRGSTEAKVKGKQSKVLL